MISPSIPRPDSSSSPYRFIPLIPFYAFIKQTIGPLDIRNWLTMSKLGVIIKQSFRIPPPTLTENNLVDQTGKIHIVTGGYAGCGQELVKILYQKNATIYVAGRSESKALKSISDIKDRYPGSKGRLEFLPVDLSDLSSIKKAVQAFQGSLSNHFW